MPVTIDALPPAMPAKQPSRQRRPSPPRFAKDPLGWLAWLDSIDPGDEDQLRRASRPAVWRDDLGRGWRVVATDDGPEIRPTLDHQPTPRTDLPIVTCLLVTPDVLQVEICSRQVRMVEALPRRRLSLVDIGKAMFTSSELPHEGLTRMDEEAFRLARSRWDAAEGRRQAAKRPSSTDG
jgi:hypothetical protein